jgi:tungstate transport system permease protein
MSTMQDSFVSAWGLVISFDPFLWQTVARSLGVSCLACIFAGCSGVFLGALLGVMRFPGQVIILLLLNTLLAMPSVVVGLFVYLLLSRSGPLGDFGWLFSIKAMVLAQSMLVFPLVTVWVRQSVASAQAQHGEQLQSIGATCFQRALLLAWDERGALATVLLTAFGRAVSEVGAVMIVGGNIDGFTRVITTAIALETSKGDLPLALGLGMVLLMVVGLINALLALARHCSHRPIATLFLGFKAP